MDNSGMKKSTGIYKEQQAGGLAHLTGIICTPSVHLLLQSLYSLSGRRWIDE
jgi:hypothetical protein